MSRLTRFLSLSGLLLAALLAGGCVQQMANQPRYEPLERSALFDNGQSARPLPADTVARGQLREDELLYQGTVDGRPAELFPFPIDETDMAEGQESYNIFCTPCHGPTGAGDGMVVRRGFPAPPSFHSERLRQTPVGRYFQVISEGFGDMPGYASQIEPERRWAIIAYVRALQLSQHAAPGDVPAETLQQLRETSP